MKNTPVKLVSSVAPEVGYQPASLDIWDKKYRSMRTLDITTG